MNAPALGEAATLLPWLVPGAATLAALARSAAAWDEVRLDPAGLLLVLRQTPPSASSSLQSLLQRPEVLDGAARLTDRPAPGFVDWNRPGNHTVYQTAFRFAHAAHFVAERSGRADPDAAWCAGFLTPLGWYAIGALAPERVATCLTDADFSGDPTGVQRHHWGRDQASIARRLSRRWGLPAWLGSILGHLDLTAEHAAALGAEPELFRIVQLAVDWVQGHGYSLRLCTGSTHEDNVRALGLNAESLDEIAPTNAPERGWQAPDSVPLLRDLLLLAAEKRRLTEAPTLLGLEADIDHLHEALRGQQRTEADRLRGHKLSALAEFAGGAGHEINNPLAVISGQAQYLLSHEPDPTRQRSLQTIVGQTKRIHQILSELMLFARPPKPRKQAVDIAALTQGVVDSLGELAAQRRVTLCYTPPAQPLNLFADAKQLHTALLCLLRNAIEAAPADGWASVCVEVGEPERMAWIVEDSGAGPAANQLEHLFDPFYSGRHAGRGRGLGLPTAWQLARSHGGDVQFAGAPAGKTRFILSLPLEPIPPTLPTESMLVVSLPAVEANGTGIPH